MKALSVGFNPGWGQMQACTPPLAQGRSLHVAEPFSNLRLSAQIPPKTPLKRDLVTMGDHLWAKRTELGLKKCELASMLRIGKYTLYQWENNIYGPRISLVPRIIEFIGYDPLYKDPSSLAERVAHYRRANGLSYEALGRRIGISPENFPKVEQGIGGVSENVIRKIEAFMVGE